MLGRLDPSNCLMPKSQLLRTGQTTHPVVCRRLTPNIYSSDDLNRPEAKRFRVKTCDLRQELDCAGREVVHGAGDGDASFL
jgi:hypothetical protein